MKKIGLFLTGWCRMLLCVGLAALPSASLGARGELLADQRLNLNLSFSSASLREVVSAFTEQTGVVFSYETSLGKRTLSDVHVVIQDAPLEEMLNTLFYDTGISWKIKDHVVALTAIPSSKKNASTGSAPSAYGTTDEFFVFGRQIYAINLLSLHTGAFRFRPAAAESRFAQPPDAENAC